MTMKDMHDLACGQCKLRDEFYEKFDSDSKRGLKYFGFISFVEHAKEKGRYVSDKPKEFPKKASPWHSDICYVQLVNQWTVRELISARLKPNIIQSRPPSSKKFYFPKSTGNLLTIKKLESFSSDSSRDYTIDSGNVETTKGIYKCKLPKKNPAVRKVKVVKKVKVASKEPKEPGIGTLKRKRWNIEKLKSNEAYEDDLFEERKVKRIGKVPEDPNVVDEPICTPRWSVPISPRELSRSPSYEDCYSPNELQNSRKVAEEYRYRRNKRIKVRVCKKPEESTDIMKEDPDTYKTLEEVRNKLEKLENMDCESDEDLYYTDSSEDCK